MQISRQQTGSFLELKIHGRLDSYWADHLSSALNEIIREGSHQIRLNLSEVDYLSSAGIRVLIQSYNQLDSLKGSFAVISPSEIVWKVLKMVKLDALLVAGVAETAQPIAAAESIRTLETSHALFEIYALSSGASLRCCLVGDPGRLISSGYRQQDCRDLLFPETSFGLGLGAFGSSFEECQNNFGEFLAVAGAAAYLPTGGANIPDYMLAAGTLIPEVKALYGVSCEGSFATLARFEAAKDIGRAGLSELVSACLKISGSRVAGVILVAETSGLVGAALKRSPAAATALEFPFAPQRVREWISFTAERAHARALALVVGIAAQAPGAPLDALLRPMDRGSGTWGHFHAAVFSYRPLKKGRLDLKTTVRTLFDTENLRDLLHLVGDHREITGAGQSEFVRGACWISPIPENAVERS